MAPTAEEIRSLLEVQIAQDFAEKAGSSGKLRQPGPIASHFHDNVEYHLNGHEFQHAVKVKGAEKLKAEIVQPSVSEIPEVIDYSKPHECKVIQVIGGGQQSEWAAAVLKATATTVTGKPFNHESVLTLQFDSNGKIVHLKNYADTLHLHNIIQGI
ncbi:hypothetical protein V8C37DRAFT_378481 [Trichoderma ceciliae]